MFDELSKYKNNGNFFFKQGDNLGEKRKDVPYLPGIYYILRLSRGKPELVYIGKADSIMHDGIFPSQTLYGRINNNSDDMHHQDFFTQKCIEENIDALDINWFVTFDEVNQDLPTYVHGLLLQIFFELHGKLPEWN